MELFKKCTNQYIIGNAEILGCSVVEAHCKGERHVVIAKAQRRNSRSESRRQAILKSAVELFVTRGYEGTSTDAIVEKSGGSKQTVYAYFGNKEGLFRAAVDSLIESAFVVLDVPATDPSNPRAALRQIAIELLTVVSVPENFELLRLIIAEGPRLPTIRDKMLSVDSLPTMPIHRVAKFLRRCATAGTLEIGNADTYAYAYLGMVSQGILRALLASEPLTTDEIIEHTDTVLPLFLRMCGVQSPAKTRAKATKRKIARKRSS